MKLSKWAKQQGISYYTACRWFHAGRIPNAVQYETGTILVNEATEPASKAPTASNCFIYCRVSNQSRIKELEYQIQRCSDFCAANGYTVQKVFKEVASGMNDKRSQLMKMLDSAPTMIIVENKDRLTRFGFNYLSTLLKKLGCTVIVMNEVATDEQDLMKDLVSVITSFCCRLYGLRRSQNKVKQIKQVLDAE